MTTYILTVQEYALFKLLDCEKPLTNILESLMPKMQYDIASIRFNQIVSKMRRKGVEITLIKPARGETRYRIAITPAIISQK